MPQNFVFVIKQEGNDFLLQKEDVMTNIFIKY